MRRAVPDGVGFEYPEYPADVAASVLAVDWGTAEYLSGRRLVKEVGLDG
jgi:hypothetical protein